MKCQWCQDGGLLEKYHDTEWGVPCHSEKMLFEYLMLEAMSCGLSWMLMLQKRDVSKFQFVKYDKRKMMKHITLLFVFSTILLCSCGSKGIKESQSRITAEMALEGVSNYCHSEYDWSMAKDNPDIMSVEMGEETDSTFQVVFRSYTGALVNFYVNKESGTTRMEEYVPLLDVKEEAGTIDLFEYLKKE